MHRRMPSPFSAALAPFILLLFVTPGLLGAQATPPVPTNHVRIHYFRPDGNYLGWTVCTRRHDGRQVEFNGGPVKVTGRDSVRAFFDVGITSAAQNVGIIIHKCNVKDHPANRSTDSRGQSAHSLSSPGQ